ncbi:auxin-responsive protein SAUR68-like [Lycium barbarum]|uniref:auxin-responsive protein SAUR68-like n=1 Tax=Lycium barbarum TaxID=112863 RepID=UPI00293E2271|nr:auxin-responsive protein SAUR68-like [Lycium barbarum]
MVSAKKLIKMARKWQKFAAKQRKRISFPRSNYNDAESCSTSSSIVTKGHFVVYTTDQKRCVVPLAYLQHEVIRQLLHMSEEEFGLSSDGPITLLCDALFMNYVISLIKRGVAPGLHNALLVSVAPSRCSSAPYLQKERNSQRLVVELTVINFVIDT